LIYGLPGEMSENTFAGIHGIGRLFELGLSRGRLGRRCEGFTVDDFAVVARHDLVARRHDEELGCGPRTIDEPLEQGEIPLRFGELPPPVLGFAERVTFEPVIGFGPHFDEIELAVVIGRAGEFLPEIATVLLAVAGYQVGEAGVHAVASRDGELLEVFWIRFMFDPSTAAEESAWVCVEEVEITLLASE